MDPSVYVYSIQVILEFQGGRWIGWHMVTREPRDAPFGEHQLEMDHGIDRPKHRDVTDMVRAEIDRCSEVEWFESHP